MKGVIISAIVAVAIVLMVEQGQASGNCGRGQTAINCGQVDASLIPCVPFLTGAGPLSPACCTGVQTIKTMSATPEDKRAACNCVKTAANRYPTLKDDAAQSLPDKCGIKLDIPISRTTNCDAI